MEKTYGVNCSQCRIRSKCLSAVFADWDRVLESSEIVDTGDYLYQEGGNLDYLYAIKSGSFKLFREEQKKQEIVGFFFPGELLGLDSLLNNYSKYNLIALERGLVCKVSLKNLKQAMLANPELNEQIINLLSLRLNGERNKSKMISHSKAEQKIACFIHWLATKFSKQGLEDKCFRLTLVQRDVASFLGISPETMSRVLAKFSAEKLLEWRCQQIVILDEKRLASIVG